MYDEELKRLESPCSDYVLVNVRQWELTSAVETRGWVPNTQAKYALKHSQCQQPIFWYHGLKLFRRKEPMASLASLSPDGNDKLRKPWPSNTSRIKQATKRGSIREPKTPDLTP